MKRTIGCLICLWILFSFAGCNSDTRHVCSGNYYAVGDYEDMLTPYLWIDADKHEFILGAGSIISYAERGTYEIADGKVIATSQSTTFEFEMKDHTTLVLIDNGDNEYFKLPINTQFVYSEV